MNSNIKKEYLKTTSVLHRAYAETSVEGEVLVPDYFPGIMRIVKTETTPFIRSDSVKDGKISVEGNVCFRVLYICENGILRSYTTAMPFSQNIDVKTERPLAYSVSAKIEYVNTRALNPQKLYFKATVSVFADAMRENETCVVKATDADNIFMLNDSITNFRIISETQKPLKVSDEIIITNKNVSQIIRHDAYVTETERKIVNGKLIVKGELILKILYLDGETSELLNTIHKSGFSQVMELKDADENCVFEINSQLSDISVSMNTNSSTTETSILFDAEIFIKAIAYKNTDEVICTDVFCTEKEMNISLEEINGQSICNVKKEITVRQTVEIGSYRKIHDISAFAELEKADYYSENGSMILCGKMNYNIIFTDSEGDYVSVDKQIPFEVSVPVSVGGSAAVARCIANIYANAFVEVDDKNIEIRTDGTCFGTVCVLTKKNALVSAELTDSPVECRGSGVTIYYADKGESVFSIAKRYGVDPESIKKSNETEDYTDKRRPVII